MYSVIWDPKALDQLNKLEKSIAIRIAKKVDELKQIPFNQDIKKLKCSSDFRLRVGDYRIIFSIEGREINIFKIGHRQQIYER